MKDKYLPIGSVVLLEGGTQTLMITGYAAVDFEQKNKMYDYSGCVYPVGVLNTKETMLFNHSQIKEICFLGYSGNEYEEFNAKLLGVMTEENINKMFDEMNQ